jgi:hypothetical protein
MLMWIIFLLALLAILATFILGACLIKDEP